MAKQIACVLTTWVGDGTELAPFEPDFTPQVGEHWANNLVDLFAVVRQFEPDLPNDNVVEKHQVVQSPITNGIGFVYVYAEHTRINAAAGNSKYLVWWTYTIDRTQAAIIATEKHPLNNPLLAELTELQSYLTTQTGKTAGQIATFLNNLFGVQDNATLQAWFLANSRKDAVNNLAIAFATQEQAN